MKFWTDGVNSLIHPADIGPKQVAWAENVIARGGIVQTRPGLKLASSVLGNRVQGLCVFTPRNSLARLVIAVDGMIYSGDWPTFAFVKVNGLEFNPDAPVINFCETIQSVKRNQDFTLEVIDPIKVLVISDGSNPAGTWDGNNVATMDPDGPKFQTPVGLWMVWTSSRLWISTGSQVRVSDIGDPTSFYEDQFLATKSFFELPNTISGMVETANERGLLVFTERTTSAFQSYIRERTTWGSTPNFQKLVFPNIGCDAGRTAVNQYGMTYWHSLGGIVSLDAALNADRTSKLQTLDGEMMRSKRNLSPDMSRACAVASDNLLLFSLPSGGKHNEHTWVLDQSPLENLQEADTAWTGVWTGIRPIQWALGHLGARQRLYCATYDRTPAARTRIHLWEALRDSRQDEGGRITCQVQFGTISDPRTLIFKYAEFEAVEILGEVSLTVFVCGMRGPWIPLHTFELRAEEGSINYNVMLDNTSILRAYKPQSRTLRTPEFTDQGIDCSVESRGKRPNRDKGFGLLFEWTGRMGIRDVRAIVDSDPSESNRGKCESDETGQVNIVLETGESQ